MSKTVVTTDLHFIEKSPFYESKVMFVDWLKEKEFNNNDNYLVVVGDITDKSIHTGIVNRMLVDFVKDLKFKHIFLITGNHDLSKRDGNVLEVLKSFDNISVIEEPTFIEIDSIYCAMLPHLIRKTKNDKSMKEIYENMEVVVNFIFGHFANETQTIFNHYIDTRHMDGKKILGHVHFAQGDFLGSPVKTRYDERNNENRIAVIDNDTKNLEYLPVPEFLSYKTIKYGEKPVSDTPFTVWTIEDAPSKQAVYNNKDYKYIYKRQILVKDGEDLDSMNLEDTENMTIELYYKEFAKQNKIKKSVSNKIYEVLGV